MCRASLPGNLFLQCAERTQIALRIDDVLNSFDTESTDELVLEIGIADEELRRSATALLEAPAEVVGLACVAETGDTNVRLERAQKAPEGVRSADGHHRDAFGGKVAAASFGERFDRALVADALDDDDLHAAQLRVPRVRRTAAMLVLFGGVFAAIALIRYFKAPDRAAYLADNQAVIDVLPRPPGAHEVSRQELSNEKAVFGEQLSHTVGYTTHVTYRVPRDATAAGIVRFYRTALSEWKADTWTVDRLPFACFDRGGALVTISPEGMQGGTGPKSYMLTVDHDGGDCA